MNALENPFSTPHPRSGETTANICSAIVVGGLLLYAEKGVVTSFWYVVKNFCKLLFVSFQSFFIIKIDTFSLFSSMKQKNQIEEFIA